MTDRSQDLREQLADLCHRQWSGWMAYLFGKCKVQTERPWSTVIPTWAVDRWQRQLSADYVNLSQAEQDSDRKEADRFLDLLLAFIDEHGAAVFLAELGRIVRRRGNARLHAKLVHADWTDEDIKRELEPWPDAECDEHDMPLNEYGECPSCEEGAKLERMVRNVARQVDKYPESVRRVLVIMGGKEADRTPREISKLAVMPVSTVRRSLTKLATARFGHFKLVRWRKEGKTRRYKLTEKGHAAVIYLSERAA